MTSLGTLVLLLVWKRRAVAADVRMVWRRIRHRRLPRRIPDESFGEHLDQALDVFEPDPDAQDAHDEILAAYRRLGQTDPGRLMAAFVEEEARR
jgi:hypothetical protein